MNIRLAAAKDAEDIAMMLRRHHKDDYMGYVTFGGGYIRGKMKKNNFFLVAEDKKIIGCVRASIVDIDLAEIRSLCVEAQHRAKGVATQLVGEAIELMRKDGMRKLVARAKADNKGAIALFEKLGFKEEGYFREHYRKGVDVVQMAMFL